MKKTIVCFANSRKQGGFCFAGKDFYENRWYRPIESGDNDSLSSRDECIKPVFCSSKARASGSNYNDIINTNDKGLKTCISCSPLQPSLLDIIEIEFKHQAPNKHQSENFIIENCQWRKVGIMTADIDRFLDNPRYLWINGYQKGNRLNDCFPVGLGINIHDSLRLIEIVELRVIVKSELSYTSHNVWKRISGKFSFKNIRYIIPITDQVIENMFRDYPDGEYVFKTYSKRLFLCISLGSEFNGYVYKFISGVILF